MSETIGVLVLILAFLTLALTYAIARLEPRFRKSLYLSYRRVRRYLSQPKTIFWLGFAAVTLVAYFLIRRGPAEWLSGAIDTGSASLAIVGLTLYAAWITSWSIYLYLTPKQISTVAICYLGDKSSEKGMHGLKLITLGDGDVKNDNCDGFPVRKTEASKGQYYMYFEVMNEIVHYFKRARSVFIIVTFYDFADPRYEGVSFNIEYDSLAETSAALTSIFRKSPQTARYAKTDTWGNGIFELTDARFDKRQQNVADFRVRCNEAIQRRRDLPDLYVRRVVLVAMDD